MAQVLPWTALAHPPAPQSTPPKSLARIGVKISPVPSLSMVTSPLVRNSMLGWHWKFFLLSRQGLGQVFPILSRFVTLYPPRLSTLLLSITIDINQRTSSTFSTPLIEVSRLPWSGRDLLHHPALSIRMPDALSLARCWTSGPTCILSLRRLA